MLDCYLLSANSYLSMGQYKHALRNCETILQADDTNFQAWFIVATAYKAEGREAKALAGFERALQLATSASERTMCYNMISHSTNNN